MQGALLSPIREEPASGRLATSPLVRLVCAMTPLYLENLGMSSSRAFGNCLQASTLSQRSTGTVKPEMLESTTALDAGALGLDDGDRRASTIGAVHQLLDRVRRASVASVSSPLAALDPRRASQAQQILRQQSLVTDGQQSSTMFTPPEGYGPRHSSYVFTMDGGGQLLEDVVRLSNDPKEGETTEEQEVYDNPGMDIKLDILHVCACGDLPSQFGLYSRCSPCRRYPPALSHGTQADNDELKKLFLMKVCPRVLRLRTYTHTHTHTHGAFCRPTAGVVWVPDAPHGL